MGNLQKTICYFKRNGLKNTYYAVKERLFYRDVPFNAGSDGEPFEGPLDESIKFSILVPVYETNEKHLREMIESCLSQLYGNFELILADASKTDGPESIIREYERADRRVKLVKVPENKGISENTNVAIDAAVGDFCALLDHDDLLTPDALYEVAMKISKARMEKTKVNLVYSDEDKCDGEATRFFDRHYKMKLNLDLFLSNNYICHFSVIDAALIKKLRFRGEYDGAQDYDMFLRVVAASEPENILYINKVLYHWRCHEASTAFNPASKDYAYDAGRRAIADFVEKKYGKKLNVKELFHKGFYEVEWGDDIFSLRPELGAVGTLYLRGNRVASGIITEDGREIFHNMNVHYSGYMHRAHLMMDVYGCDIRTVTPAPSMQASFDEVMKEFKAFEESHPCKKDVDEYAKLMGLKFGDAVKDKKLLFLYTSNIK